MKGNSPKKNRKTGQRGAGKTMSGASAAVALASWFIMPQPVDASTLTRSGDWETSGNWSGGIPNSSSTTTVDNYLTVSLQSGESGLSSTLFIGHSNAGTMNINGGELTDATGYLGYGVGSNGTATINNGTWANTSNLYVGYSGAGTLNITNFGAVSVGGGLGTIILAENAGSTGTLNINEGYVYAAGITSGAGTATVNFSSAGSETFAPTLSGALSVHQLGTGTLMLSSSNSYTGGTTVSGGGTLQIGSDSQLGAVPVSPTVNITLNDGLLVNTDNDVTLHANRTIDLSGGGGYIQASFGKTFTVNGAITGVGGLGIAWDGGIVLLAGSNSYTGPTTIGTTAINYWNNPGAIPTLQLGSSHALNGTDLIFGTALNNEALLNMCGYNALVGMLSGNANALVNNGEYGSLSTLTVGANNASSTFQGAIEGWVNLVKTGTGTLTLNGANTYSGSTTVNAGALIVSSNSALSPNTSVTINGYLTTLQFSGNTTAAHAVININSNDCSVDFYNSSTAGNASISSNNTNSYISFYGTSSAANATLTVPGENSGAEFFDASTAGNATINLTGPGPAALFSGTSTASQATITASGPNTFVRFQESSTGGSARVVLQNSTSFLDISSLTPGSSVTLGSLEGSGAARLGGKNLALGGNGLNTTFSGMIEDGGFSGGTGGSITKVGPGRLTLSGNNTYTGGTTLDGGMLSLGSSGALGNVGTITFGGGTLQYSQANGNDYSNRFSTAANQQYNVDTNGGNVVWASSLTSAGGSLTKSGLGGLKLTGSNSFSGGITLSSGSLRLGSLGALGSTGAIFFSGGTLQYTSDNTTDYSNRFSTAANQHYNVDTNGVNVTWSAPLTSSGGSLAKFGAGTLTLISENTYTGQTTINAGTLQLGDGVNYGGWLNGNITNNATLVFANPSTQTYNGVISGNGALVKLGTNTLILTGSNTYSGGTTVSGSGILQINSDAQLGAVPGSPTTNITLNGGMLMNNGAEVILSANRNISLGANGGFIRAGYDQNFTINGQISGVGGLGVAWDDATVVLGGSNSYTGATTIGTTAIGYYGSSPTLQLGNSHALPGTDLIFGTALSNNVSLNMNGFNATVAALSGSTNASVLNGGVSMSVLTVGNNDASSTFQGIINQGVSLVKIGTGTLTLTGASNYDGATMLNAGTLHLSNQQAFQNSTVTMNGGGLVFDSSVSSHLFNFGGLSASASGVGYNLALQDTAGNAVGLHVGGNGFNTTYPGVLSGSGSVTKVGSGMLTLTGNNNYSGGTTISAGTLQLGDGATSNGSVSGNITDNAALVFANPYAQSFAGNINGSGSLAKTGAGALTLTGSNNYSGGTTIHGGQLNVSNSNNIGSGALTLSGSSAGSQATLNYSPANSTLTVGSLALHGFATINLQPNSAIQSSGAITINGTGNLISLMGNTWALGNNTLLFGTSLTSDSGAISLTGDTINDQVLALGGTTTIGRTSYTFGYNATSLYLLTAGIHFDLVWTGAANNQWDTTSADWQSSDGGQNPTGENIAFISDDDVYFKTGASDITVTNTGVHAGGVYVANTSGTVSLNGGDVSASNLVKSGSGALSISNALVLSGTFENIGDGAVTVAGAFTGGQLIQNGSGTLLLTGTSAFTGAATVNNGTLQVSDGGKITQTSGIVIDSVSPATNATLIVDGPASSVTSAGDLTIGNYGRGTLDVTNGGTVSTLAGFIGYQPDANGTATVSGPGSIWTTQETIEIGLMGAGTLNVTNNGAVAAASVYVGDTGTGILAINSGGSLASEDGFIGRQYGSNGAVTVLGAGSTWTNTQAISIGEAGTGALNVTNGGAVSTGNIYVGYSGTGTLNVTSGGTLVSQNGDINWSPGANGTATVDGAGSIWTSGNLLVGNRGTGALNIQNGGTVNVSGGSLTLANSVGSVGTLNIGTGAGSGALNVAAVAGGAGTANVNFNHSDAGYTFAPQLTGALTVSQIGSGRTILTGTNTFTGATNIAAGTLSFANGSLGAAGTVDFTGNSTLQWYGVNTQDVSSRLKIEDGISATLDTNGNNVTFASALQTGLNHTGALTKTGAGTLALTATNNYEGATNVSAGTLQVASGGAITRTGSILVDGFAASNAMLTVDGEGSSITSAGSLTVGNVGTGTLNIQNGGSVNVGGGGGSLLLANGVGSLATVNIGNGTDSGTLNAGVVVGGLGSAIVNFNHSNASYTFASQITGTIALNQLGSGGTILTGANTYTGATNIAAGTLSFANAGLGSDGTVDFTGNSTLQWYGNNTQDVSSRLKIEDGITATIDTNGNNVTFASALQTGTNQTAALTKAGAGMITLTATNNYTGGTNIEAGTLSFAAGSLGMTGTVDFTGNSTLQWYDNTQDISSRLKIEDGITATVDTNNNNVIFASALQTGTNQTAALTKAGAGTLTLTATNNYTGGTNIEAGTLSFAASSLGTAGTVGFSGNSTLQWNGHTQDISNRLKIEDGITATIDTNGNDLTFASALQTGTNQTGALTKAGSGMLTLTGTNTYAGATAVNNGALLISDGGAITQTSNIVVDSVNPATDATLTVDGAGSSITSTGNATIGDTGTGTLNIQNGGVVNVGSTGSNSMMLANSAGSFGTLNIGNGAGSGTLNAGVLTGGSGTAVVNFNHSDAGYVFVPQIAGSLTVNQIGSGRTILTGSNTYTGTTNIAAGTLSFANAGLGAAGTVDFTGNSTLQWYGANTQDISSRLKIEDGITATIDTNGNNVIFASALQTGTNQTAALTKVGGGTLALAAANTYTGITTISAGTLNLSNQNAVANSTVTMNGGGLVFDNSVSGRAFTLGGLSASFSGVGYDIALQDNAGTPNAVALSVGNNNANTTYAGNLSGTGSLTKIGAGTLTLTGSSNYTGGTNISSGTLSFADWSLGSVGTVDFTGNSTLQWYGANTQDISSRLKIEDGITATLDTTGNNVLLASAFQTGASKTGALTKIGAGMLTLTGSNDYTGGTNINAGALSFANGSLGTLGTVDFTGNTTLQWYGTNTQDISSRLKIEDGITATIDTNGNNVTFASTLQTGTNQTGALTKTGAGKLTMTSLGTYRGGTNINEGTLSFAVWSLGNLGLVDFTGNSTLQWYGDNTQDISSRLKIEDGVTARFDTNGNDVTFASALQTGTNQTGALTKAGLGTLTLTATNTYMGATTVNSGTLQISNGGVITQTASVMVDSIMPATSATLTVDGIGNSVTSLGGVTAGDTGTGILTIQNGGVMNVGSTGTGALMLANSVGSFGTLNIGDGGAVGTLNASIVNGGSGTAIVNFNHNNYGYIFLPQIVGSASVNQIGAGTTILTGTNTYTGATTISNGILEVSGGAAITQTSNVTVDSEAPASNATLVVDGSILSSVTSTGNVTVGNSNTGMMNIINGGTVSNDTGYVGYQASANGTVTVSGSSSTWTNTGSLNIGYKGSSTGVLSITDGGSVTNDAGYIGYEAGAEGTVTVSGTNATWTNTGDLNIGYNGNSTGTLNIMNGGSVSNAAGYIGNASDANGTVTVSGANATWTNSGNLYVSYNSDGISTLSVKNGGAVTSGTGYIGYGAGSTGTVEVSDADSTWKNTGDLYVGYSGNGTLNINDEGKVTNDSKGFIGYGAGTIGAVTVSGASTWKNTSDLNVGYNGSGTLNVTGGSTLTSGAGNIGTNAGSNGTMTVSGISTWDMGKNDLYVGNAGGGTLNITGGSTIANAQGFVGNSAGSNGVVNMASSTWNNNGGLYIGYSGTGTVIVNGGSLTTGTNSDIFQLPKGLYVGYNSTGVGSLTITDSALSTTSGCIGNDAGSHGTVTLEGSSTWGLTLMSSFTIGNKGTGTLNINGSSKVTNSAAYIATNDGATGTVTVSGGTWENEATLYVGNDTTNGKGGGHATLNILAGGSVTSYNGILGGTNSSVTISGKDSSWEISDPHHFSGEIEGMLETYAGTTLTISDGGKLTVEKMCAIIGTATVDNGTWKNADALMIGGATLNITNGGQVFAKSVTISKNGDIAANVTVDGNDSYLWYTPKDLLHPLPESDNSLKIDGGMLNITNGGQVNFDSLSIGSGGSVTMSGNGATLTIEKGFDVNKGTLTVGSGATVTLGGYFLEGTLNIGKEAGDNGVVNLDNGGILNTNDGNGTAHIGFFGKGALNITGTVGGVLQAAFVDGGTDATINFNHSDPNYVFSPVIQSGVDINQNGSGTTSLKGENTQFGGTATVNAGTLKLSNANAVYQGVVKMNGGHLAFDHSVSGQAFSIGGLSSSAAGAGYDIVLQDTEGSPVALSVGSNNGDSTYAGILSGAGSLSKICWSNAWYMADNGTLKLTGANTYTGATVITAGTLTLGNQYAIQNSTLTINDITLEQTNKGGTLAFDSAVSGHAFTIGGLSESSKFGIVLHDTAGNPVALSVGNNNASTSFAGTLSGAGSLTKIGNGTLTLTEKNTYSGGTIVNSGTLALAAANECSGTTTLTGGALKLSNQNAVQNSTVKPNGGSLVFDSAVSGHAFTIGGISTSNAAYNIVLHDDAGNPVALTVGNNNESTGYAAILSGSGSVIKSGTGTLTLFGRGLYTGATTVNNGTLTVFGGLIKETSSVTVDSTGTATNATLAVDGTIDGSVTSTGNATVGESGTGTLNIQNGGVVTLGGIYGSGTLTLAKHVGSAGTLNIIDDGENLPGGLSAAVLTGGSGTAIVNFNHSDPFYNFAAQIEGSVTVNQNGAGTTILSKANTHTGATNVNAGALNLSNQFAAENSTVTMNGGSLVFDSSVYQHAFTFGGLAASSSGVGYDIALQDNADPSNAVALSVGNNNADTLYAAALSGNGSLTKIGTGTLTFTGTNSYTGTTTVSSGTLMVAGGGKITQTSSVTVNGVSSASLTVDGTSSVTSVGNMTVGDSGVGALNIQNGAVVNVGGIGGTGTLTLASSVDSAGTLNIGNGGAAGTLNAASVTGGLGSAVVNFNHTESAYNFATPINGTTTVNHIGGGTTILMGESNYTGATNLNAGTLSMGSTGAIGTTSTISFGGGTLQYTASNTTDYSNRFSAAAGQLYNVDTNSQNVTWSTALTSSGGSLTKGGAGMLTLTGANSFDGGTTINSGVVRLASGGALASAGTVTLSGDSTNLQFTGNTSAASATINASGSSALVQFGDSSTAANATINATGAGSVVQFSDSSVGGNASIALSSSASSVDISAHASGTVAVGSVEGSGTVYLGGNNLSVGSNGQSKTFSGAISDGGLIHNLGGSITKTGAGSLTLTGVSTYTGATNVAQGTLTVSGTLNATFTAVVAPGALLQVTQGGVINNTSPVALSGTLSGAGTVQGVTATGGVIAPGTPGSQLTISGTASLDATSSFQFTLGSTITSYDSLVAGKITLVNGSSLVLADPFHVATNFVFGNTIQLFSNVGGGAPLIDGLFTNLTLPTLVDDLEWNTSRLYTTGQLEVVPEPNTLFMLIGGLGTMLLAKRLRRARCEK